MSKPGPETLLVDRIRKAIKREHPTAWVMKVHGSPYQPAGIPDLLVVLDGHLTGIEVKAPRSAEATSATMARVTPRQWATIEALRRAGATAGVAFSVEAALRLLDHSACEAPGSQSAV